MSKPTTSKATLNATSSPESEAGASPADSPIGRMTDTSGQEAAHASPSPLPEKDSARLTKGTSGRRSAISSASVNLSMSLANKLQTLFGTAGSMEYRQTWKLKATPAARLYWAHTASVHRIKGKGSTGQPDVTPWQTPSVEDAGREGSAQNWQQYANQGKTTQCRLRNEVHLSPWPTPQEDDASNVRPSEKRRETLAKVISQFASGIHTGSSTAKVSANAYRLNPGFAGWLMGFPALWTLCGMLASLTEKSRKPANPIPSPETSQAATCCSTDTETP